MPFRRLEYIIGFFISLAAFVVYVITLCPTVNFIDSGELATDAYTLGIAHPTGYPLFTLLGWLFSHLPLGLRIIYQLNLMAAVFCAGGLFFFFRFIVLILRRFIIDESQPGFSEKDKTTEKNMWKIFIPAGAGTFLLAFSETYWSQALSIEVYSMHVLFLSLLLYFFVNGILLDINTGDERYVLKSRRFYWYGFAFILGLSFSNHMTTILLAPAFLYFFFSVNRFSISTWRRIGWMTVPFILGFSVYLYLPIRAGVNPLMNWGNPVTFERFLWHFSGKVYRVWIFSSTESAMKQLQYYVDTFPGEFAYAAIPLVIVGLWKLFRSSKKVFMSTILLFLGCLFYSINYDIHDIDSYFLLTYLTIAIWSAMGIRGIVDYVRREKAIRWTAVGITLFCLLPLYINYQKVDESDNRMVEDYTKDMLSSIKPDGIIMSYQWDYFISAAYYLQLVEKFRTDVIIIDKELLRRSWYLHQLETRYPGIIQESKSEVDAFLKELYKFEHDLPYNAEIIEYRYSRLIQSIADKNYYSHPLYITHEIEPQYLSQYHKIPSGLALQLTMDTVYHSVFPFEFEPKLPRRTDTYRNGLVSQYAQAYLNTAMYLNFHNRTDEAVRYIDKSLQIWPNFQQALIIKEKIKKGR